MAAAVWEAVVAVVSLLLAASPGADSQRNFVQMSPSVQVIQGGNVTLRCILQSEEAVSQVTWTLRRTSISTATSSPSSPVHVATKSQMFGSSVADGFRGRADFSSTDSVRDGSLHLSSVLLVDQGMFVCDFTLFPSGSVSGETELIVMVRPVVSLVPGTNVLVAGAPALAAGLCRAANGKPAAVVTWSGRGPAPVVMETGNPDGTVSVVSELRVLPSRDINGETVVCTVTHPTLTTPETRSLTLSVMFPPEVVVAGFDGSWWVGRRGAALVCETTANPPAHHYAWHRGNESVSVLGLDPGNSTLRFPILSPDLSGEFSCTARNRFGSYTAGVVVRVTDPPPTSPPSSPSLFLRLPGRSNSSSSPPPGGFRDSHGNSAGAIAGGVVGGLLAAAVAAFAGHSALRHWRRSRFRGDYDAKKGNSSAAGNSAGNSSGNFGNSPGNFGNSEGGGGAPGTPPPRYASETLPLAFRSEFPGGISESGFGREEIAPVFWGIPSERRRRMGEEEEEEEEGGGGGGGSGIPDGTPPGSVSRGFLMPVEHDLVPQRDGSMISKKEWYV